MTLVLENKNITQNFVVFLKNRMLSYMSTILDTRKLTSFDEYFMSDEFKLLTNGVKVSSRRVILLGMTTLVHKRFDTTTQIFMNPNITYPGTSLKIYDLCKLINYGTISIDGYPIFTDTFNYFSKNIEKYVDRYTRGLG